MAKVAFSDETLVLAALSTTLARWEAMKAPTQGETILDSALGQSPPLTNLWRCAMVTWIRLDLVIHTKPVGPTFIACLESLGTRCLLLVNIVVAAASMKDG